MWHYHMDITTLWMNITASWMDTTALWTYKCENRHMNKYNWLDRDAITIFDVWKLTILNRSLTNLWIKIEVVLL